VTRGQLQQRAGSLGLNGGGTAAAVPPFQMADVLSAPTMNVSIKSWSHIIMVNELHRNESRRSLTYFDILLWLKAVQLIQQLQHRALHFTVTCNHMSVAACATLCNHQQQPMRLHTCAPTY